MSIKIMSFRIFRRSDSSDESVRRKNLNLIMSVGSSRFEDVPFRPGSPLHNFKINIIMGSHLNDLTTMQRKLSIEVYGEVYHP